MAVNIFEKSTGKIIEAVIEPMSSADYIKVETEGQFSHRWNKYVEESYSHFRVFKLAINEDNKILCIMSLVDGNLNAVEISCIEIWAKKSAKTNSITT